MGSVFLVDSSQGVFLRRGVLLFFWLVKSREVGWGSLHVCSSHSCVCITSVLICRMILPRFCSGEFFTFRSLVLILHYTDCRMESIPLIIINESCDKNPYTNKHPETTKNEIRNAGETLRPYCYNKMHINI